MFSYRQFPQAIDTARNIVLHTALISFLGGFLQAIKEIGSLENLGSVF